MEIINVDAHPRNHNLGDFILLIVNKQWCILPHELWRDHEEIVISQQEVIELLT
jgi:hypothetical protein